MDSTNCSEENDSKTIDDQLEVGDVGTEEVVGDDGRDNDDVANNSAIGDHGCVNSRQCQTAKCESKYQNHDQN